VSILFRWLDERIDLAGLRRALLDREVPARLTWWHTLGSATLTVFLVQAITGVVLAVYYSASPDHAYDSVQFMNRQLGGGALLHGMHHWAASVMVVLLAAHMIRVFAVGAYKYPREVNWLVGVALFLIVMAFSFTGYLLPWDQKAYWATAVGTNIAGTAPVIGGFLVALLRGGAELGAATLARFYAFHVLWLPALLGGLVLVHLAMVVRQGIAPRPAALERGAPPHTSHPSYAAYYREAYAATKLTGARFWPDVLAKDAFVSLGVVAAIVVLGATLGAPLERPADPSDTAYVPRPEWYFLPLYQLLRVVPGSLESVIAVGVPMALIVAMLALPFFDRRATRNLLHRPFAAGTLVVLLGGSGLLLGVAARSAPPAVPPEVGHPLRSTESAGRALFAAQECRGCHTVAGQGGQVGPDLTDIGLHHSPAWIHSFLEAPRRFHPTGVMPAFAPPTLSHQEIEQLAQYLSTLRGNAGPNVQPQYADTFPDASP
jgi:ubiquinol-cytochrome c reductase cytochrome b subunit